LLPGRLKKPSTINKTITICTPEGVEINMG
jgi:hypothetical protein